VNSFVFGNQSAIKGHPIKLRLIQSHLANRTIAARMIALAAIALVGCQRAVSEPANPTKPATAVTTIFAAPTIAIKELPTAAQNTTVYIKGVVGDRVPLLGGTAYQLQDVTGNVWVVSKTPAPATGQESTLKGIVRYKSIPVNGKEKGGIYIEQE
jgi:uncharacterized protein YdeI (BOF family)